MGSLGPVGLLPVPVIGAGPTVVDRLEVARDVLGLLGLGPGPTVVQPRLPGPVVVHAGARPGLPLLRLSPRPLLGRSFVLGLPGVATPTPRLSPLVSPGGRVGTTVVPRTTHGSGGRSWVGPRLGGPEPERLTVLTVRAPPRGTGGAVAVVPTGPVVGSGTLPVTLTGVTPVAPVVRVAVFVFTLRPKVSSPRWVGTVVLPDTVPVTMGVTRPLGVSGASSGVPPV